MTLIGCPKLDEGDYSEKLTAIIKANDIKSLTIVRMEVPCCGGIELSLIHICIVRYQNKGVFVFAEKPCQPHYVRMIQVICRFVQYKYCLLYTSRCV